MLHLKHIRTGNKLRKSWWAIVWLYLRFLDFYIWLFLGVFFLGVTHIIPIQYLNLLANLNLCQESLSLQFAKNFPALYTYYIHTTICTLIVHGSWLQRWVVCIYWLLSRKNEHYPHHSPLINEVPWVLFSSMHIPEKE